MQTFKTLALTVTLALSALAPLPGMTQSADSMTRGEVRKVDKEAGKITIKHEEIKSLDMPPMAMVFTVKDKSLLDKVQAGDKIKFTAISEGGKLLVTDIQTAKP